MAYLLCITVFPQFINCFLTFIDINNSLILCQINKYDLGLVKRSKRYYFSNMNTLSTIALVVAMLLVLGVLGMGMFSMVKGGEFNKKYGNKLMQARVIMQGVALALLALAYYTSQTS